MQIEQSSGVEGEDLVDTLVQTAFAVMAVLTRIAAGHDVSLTQLRVFGILRDRRLRMAELAEFLGLDRSTMTGLVDRAERRGLLERGRNADDGRAVDVYMTPAGSALAVKVDAEVRRALNPLTGRLDATQRRTLAPLLGGMLDQPND